MYIAVDLETYRDKKFGRKDLAIRYAKDRIRHQTDKAFSIRNIDNEQIALVLFSSKFKFPEVIWN